MSSNSQDTTRTNPWEVRVQMISPEDRAVPRALDLNGDRVKAKKDRLEQEDKEITGLNLEREKKKQRKKEKFQKTQGEQNAGRKRKCDVEGDEGFDKGRKSDAELEEDMEEQGTNNSSWF